MQKFNLIMEKNSDYKSVKLDNPSIIFEELRDHLGKQAEEVLMVVCVDIKLNDIGRFEVSRGSLNASIVSIREIFKRVMLCNAHSFFLVHNHPSGDLTPSHSDIEVTKAVKKASNILQIELLDHVIISQDDYVSLKEQGLF